MGALLLLVILVWTFGLGWVVLGRLLSVPERKAMVRVRVLPWPWVEISVGGECTCDAHRGRG
ncbi:MAG: hypothetical protein GEV28_23115 [Actinophytocola sp.]|uniref:hypothetical protein n=1 Tax=Actinophytocola sp. TaxID=1872138 RepID=UPI00132A3EF6|nr:hypothetical protein [Actinophytocola sp.]MPZ83124.1 hypothetical protein [Actinophytocola sp.]